MKDFTLEQIKQMIDDTMAYDKPTGQPYLDNEYWAQEKLIAHLNPYYRLFYQISRQLEPDFVVELGGWQGLSAGHFGFGNPKATVVTIDHHTDPGDDFNQTKMLQLCAAVPNVEYLKGWTWDVIDNVKSYNKTIDILFIDSWHEYQYFKRDWDLYSPLLSETSLTICDDIMDTELFIDMVKFWNELPGQKILDGRPHPGVPMGFIKIEPDKPEVKKTLKRGRKSKSSSKAVKSR